MLRVNCFIRIIGLFAGTKKQQRLQRCCSSLNFDNEILNNINKYDKSYSLTYNKNYTSDLDIHNALKEILTHANEEDAPELLFQVNPKALKNNVQLIRIKDDDVLIYIAGKSLFKKGKFDVDKIGSFNIIIMYND